MTGAKTSTTVATKTTIKDEFKSPIREFYKGKSIVVTGSTGFIGKVLIEKLLYSCPEVKKIYLLIRSAHGVSPQQRMLDMISQRPFDIRLKQEFVASKLEAIDCDLAKPGLGLSAESQALLINLECIIFHVAASVKFEAPLEVNMRHNVVATKELLQFACQFKQLACFVHVSTAYSNCQLREIDERVYHMDVPEDPISLEVTQEMLENRPNTYTYTKAMAENVASQYASRMNVVIVRPSIVMSSMSEPTEGWVDTINGPVGLSVLGALGILQKIKVNSEVVFDLIPVDVVVNALVAIAWAATEKKYQFSSKSAQQTINNNNNNNNTSDINEPKEANIKNQKTTIRKLQRSNEVYDSGSNNNNNNSDKQANNNTIPQITLTTSTETTNQQQQQQQQAKVFNLTTGSENPCSFYQYFSIGREAAYTSPSTRALRPILTIPRQKGMNPVQYWIHKVLTHLLFAYLIDLILSIVGQKRMVVKAVNRMHHANEVFDYFCSNQWTFNTDNVKRMRELQSNEDKRTFYCDVRQINWNAYAKTGWVGCRRFILKESDDSVEYARSRYRTICWIFYSSKIILLLALTSLTLYCIDSRLVLTTVLLPIYGTVYLL